MHRNKTLITKASAWGGFFLILSILTSLPLFISPSSSLHPEGLLDDEGGFYPTGKILFRTFFIEHDFSSEVWKNSCGRYGSYYPRISLYVIGFFDHLAQKIHLLIDPLQPVIIIKLCMAMLSAGSVLFFFRLIQVTASTRAAIFGASLLLVNPIFRDLQYRVLPEPPMVFFTMLSLLSFAYIDLRLKSHTYPWKWLIISGIAMGLAIGSKLHAFALVPVSLLIFKRRMYDAHWVKIIVAPILVLTLSFMVFVLSNPLLYSDFFYGMRMMTSNHVAVYGGGLFRDLSKSFQFVTIPFILFQFYPFPFDFWPVNLTIGNLLSMVIGYILLIGSLIKSSIKKDYLPLGWLASGLLFVFFVSSLRPGWSKVKIFILPVIALIWLISSTLPRWVEHRK